MKLALVLCLTVSAAGWAPAQDAGGAASNAAALRVLTDPAPSGGAVSDPANPNANAKARALLQYIQGLAAQTNHNVLSGQFTQFGPGANMRILEEIHDRTGHWPAIAGADLADFGGGTLTTNHPDRLALEYWKQGGIVTISAHLYDPAGGHGYGLRDKGVDLSLLLTPGPAHDAWMAELDKVAAGLDALKRDGVVVLWRPFHEMNGGWFWWGGKDPKVFAQVWRQMFDYFSRDKGLDNLLWVYAPNMGRMPAAYYPGANYVDLVGLDAYTDHIDKEHITGYDEVSALGKPFGFTEYGPHGASNPPGDYDYRAFLDGVKTNFPKTCFFMCWNDGWSLARNFHVKEMLENPAIANLEDIPKGLTGN